MKLQRLIQEVYFEPAVITPEAHASIRTLLESRLADEELKLNPDGKRETTYCGEKVELPSMEVIDGVAHIPIGGAIGHRLSNFAKYAGAVDVEDVAEEIDMAMSDRKVRAILFDIDSPGGMVTGTPELADKIAGITKPKYAFSTGLMASAAYWIGSSTDAIFTTRTSNIGSIGVYMTVFDESQRYEKAGVKVEMIKAGKLKGLGYPGTSLSEAGREHLQERVNEIYAMFKNHVLTHRGGAVADETMQGQTFMAPQALKRGLIDQIVKDKAEVVRML